MRAKSLVLGFVAVCALFSGFLLYRAVSDGAIETTAGVVVDQGVDEKLLSKLDLREGDVLLQWDTTARLDLADGWAPGDLTTPFEWARVVEEIIPRGGADIERIRNGQKDVVRVPVELANEFLVRPQLAPGLLSSYLDGRARIGASDVEAGVAKWIQAAVSASTDGNHQAACWLYDKAAGRMWASKKWDRVDELLALASAESRSAADRTALVFILQRQGGTYRDRGNLQKATETFEEALELRTVWGQGVGFAGVLEELAAIWERRSDLDRAKSHYEQALAIHRKTIPGNRLEYTLLNNLGTVLVDQGDLAAAEHCHLQALENRSKMDPKGLDVVRSLGNLAIVSVQRGDLARTESYAKRGLAIVEKENPDSFETASLLNTLGGVAFQRGDDAAAELYFRRALTIVEALKSDYAVALFLNNLGGTSRNRRDLRAARDYFTRAYAIQERISAGSMDASLPLLNLGEVCQDEGDFGVARDYYRRSLAIRERHAPGGFQVAVCLRYLGDLALQTGDLEAATQYFGRCLKIRESLAPGSILHGQSINRVGRVLNAKGKRREALRYFQDSIATLESLENQLSPSEESRSSFTAQYLPFYEDAIGALVELGRREDAFQVLERSRARSFLNMLAARDILLGQKLPADLDPERKRLAKEYEKTQGELAKLSPVNDRPKIEQLLVTLQRGREERGALARRIAAVSPRNWSLRYPRPLGSAEVSKALEQGTALLSYCVTKGHTWLFSVTAPSPSSDAAQSLRVYRINIGEDELKRQVEEFRRKIQSGERGLSREAAIQEQGQALFATLMKPAEAEIQQATRLLVCPDGPLHVLPFGALTVSSLKSAGASAPYLISWKPLTVILSATVYAELQQSRPKAAAKRLQRAPQVMAFGDPRYPSTSGPRAVGLENPQAESLLTRGVRLSALPGTRREVEEIAKLFPRTSQIFTASEASEEKAKTHSGQADYLHFACHGVLDDRFPLDSSLALSVPDKPAPGQENGFLQAWEIMEQLRLNADLVTLSACDTGLGQDLGGEGLVGLTRAFQFAGARSVLATLWNLSDESSGYFMQRFYTHLAKGESKDSALRKAQLDMLGATPRLLGHPYHWAGFELVGDWK